MLTRTATYPDRATAVWCTQQVIRLNAERIAAWLAQGTRRRLTLEGSWPSRDEPVGRVLLQSMFFAGRGPVDVRSARVVLERDDAAAEGFVTRTSVPVYW
jgi:Bacterial CdiA-CT RNAse A domain